MTHSPTNHATNHATTSLSSTSPKYHECSKLSQSLRDGEFDTSTQLLRTCSLPDLYHTTTIKSVIYNTTHMLCIYHTYTSIYKAFRGGGGNFIDW